MTPFRVRGRTASDIEVQVDKLLRGLGSPEPPLDLEAVRQLLRLDLAYYGVSDDSVLRESVSRLIVAGRQVIERPMLLFEAVRKLSLKALYLPDRKRILLDQSLPPLKHRWNEAHEIGHDIIPWHAGMMLGDTTQTLTLACHTQMEAEANYAAGQVLFLADRFRSEALDLVPNLNTVKILKDRYGNTYTSTLWRYVEQAPDECPMVAMVSTHPHVTRRGSDFDPAVPCKYLVCSPAFEERFGAVDDRALFDAVAGYCGSQRGGPLGECVFRLKRPANPVQFGQAFWFNSASASGPIRPGVDGDEVMERAQDQ